MQRSLRGKCEQGGHRYPNVCVYSGVQKKKIKETVKTNNVQSKVRRAPRTNPVQSSFTRRTERKRAVYTMYNSVEAMRSVIYRLYSDRRHVLMVLFAKSRLHAIGMNVRRG